MLTVNKRIAQGQGLAPSLVKRAASVELDWDLRQKSRFETTDSAGRVLGVFLARGTVLRGGDVLVGVWRHIRFDARDVAQRLSLRHLNGVTPRLLPTLYRWSARPPILGLVFDLA